MIVEKMSKMVIKQLLAMLIMEVVFDSPRLLNIME